MDAGDILGHCWCLRKVLAKSLSMPPLAYSPPASPDAALPDTPDAALPDTPTPCGHDAPVLWRTDSTFFLVGGGLAFSHSGVVLRLSLRRDHSNRLHFSRVHRAR